MTSTSSQVKARWVWAALFMSIAMPGMFAPVYLKSFDLTDFQLGQVFATGFLFSAIVNFSLSYIADRTKTHVLMYGILPVLQCMPFLAQSLALPQIDIIPKSILFPFILLTNTISTSFRTSTIAILTSITITQLQFMYGKDGHRRFGEERLWGAVSWAACSVIIGAILDIPNVSVWPLYAGSIVAAMVNVISTCVYYVRNNEADDNIYLPEPVDEEKAMNRDVHNQNSTQTTFQKLYRLIIDGGMVNILFFNLTFWLSMGMSLVEYFLFLFLQKDLNASNFICGLSVVVTVIFEIPIFARAPHLLEKLGSTSLILFGALGFVIRVLGYVIAPSGVVVLLVEPLHGITFGAYQIASVAYLAERAPPDLEATAQSILSVISTIATSLGLLLGGYIMQNYGSKKLYFGAAVAVLIATVALACADRFSEASKVKFDPNKTSSWTKYTVDDADENPLLVKSEESEDG